MKKQWKRGMACITAAVLLVSMTAALAAGPEPSTVHANLHFSELHIYYESKQVAFVSADNATVHPISYNGSVYLPIRSAGEWMGKEVAWDPDAQTVTLSGSVTPEVKGYGYETRKSTQEELDNLYHWMDYGMDVQIRPDITILVDGQEQHFVNVKGEAVYPIAWNGTVFLPLRSISELCGLEISYVPDKRIAGHAWIYIRKAMPDSEKIAIETYLDRGLAIGEGLPDKALRFLNLPDSEQAEALALLKDILADLTEIQQMPKPGGTYFDAAYERIQYDLENMISPLKQYVAAMEDGVSLSTLRTTGIDTGDPLTSVVGGPVSWCSQYVKPYFQLAKDIFLMAGSGSY